MQNHPFFSSQASQEIPLDIVFDQEPPEGLRFQEGKIYVNTKDPTAYQRLHQAAVEKFLEENGDLVNQNAKNMLEAQLDGVEDLFPNLSDRLI